MSNDTLTITRGPWTFVWHGGRLMDVYHADSDTALDCKQVGAYDWETGKLLVPFTVATLEAAADEWFTNECEFRNITTHMLPYYRRSATC